MYIYVYIYIYIFIYLFIYAYLQAENENEEMEKVRAINMRLVANMLPSHVAEHFLKSKSSKEEVRLSNRMN